MCVLHKGEKTLSFANSATHHNVIKLSYMWFSIHGYSARKYNSILDSEETINCYCISITLCRKLLHSWNKTELTKHAMSWTSIIEDVELSYALAYLQFKILQFTLSTIAEHGWHVEDQRCEGPPRYFSVRNQKEMEMVCNILRRYLSSRRIILCQIASFHLEVLIYSLYVK